MNNGQYYRSAELVDLIHKNFSGFHAGYRGVHASGRYYAAIFKASGEAGKLSRAAQFPRGTSFRVGLLFERPVGLSLPSGQYDLDGGEIPS